MKPCVGDARRHRGRCACSIGDGVGGAAFRLPGGLGAAIGSPPLRLEATRRAGRSFEPALNPTAADAVRSAPPSLQNPEIDEAGV
jgi:hypothetical protein